MPKFKVFIVAGNLDLKVNDIEAEDENEAIESVRASLKITAKPQ